MRKAIFSVFILFLLVGTVNALTTPTSDIVVTVERGTAYEFALVFQNIEPTTQTVTFSSPSSWILFEGNLSNYTLNVFPNLPTYIRVKISVPPDTIIGTYDTQINANNAKLSDIKIKVTLPLNEVQQMEIAANTNQKITKLQTDLETLLNQKISALNSSLSSSIASVADYRQKYEMEQARSAELQDKVSELESRLTTTEGQVSELSKEKEEINRITGMITSIQPTLFAGGFIMGILIYYFAKNKKFPKLSLKRKQKVSISSEREEDNRPRYEYKPE